MTAISLAVPLLTIALMTGLTVSVIQTATSVQEQSLTFVPKLLGVGGGVALLLPWLLEESGAYLRYAISLAGSLAR
ncbi:MAG: flagellar biosynthetic protein FliQ [Planctomycetes bacterium]|nr:flagellar biosynthetic protein FliQ [Planctomycetota bacterium]